MFSISLVPSGNIATENSVIELLPNYKIAYDGNVFDFSSIGDGQQVEAEYPAIGIIERVGSVLHITLAFLYDVSLAEPNQPTDISNLTYELESGFVPDPVIYKEVTENV